MTLNLNKFEMSQESRNEEFGITNLSPSDKDAITALLNLKDDNSNFQRNLTKQAQITSYQVDGIFNGAPIVLYVSKQWYTSFYELNLCLIRDSIRINLKEGPNSEGSYYDGWFHNGTKRIFQRRLFITDDAISLLLKNVDSNYVPVITTSLHSTLTSIEFDLTYRLRSDESYFKTRSQPESIPVPLPPLIFIPRALLSLPMLRDIDFNNLTYRFNRNQQLRLGYILCLRTALLNLKHCPTNTESLSTVNSLKLSWIYQFIFDQSLLNENRPPGVAFASSDDPKENFQLLGKSLLYAHSFEDLTLIKSFKFHNCSLSSDCIINRMLMTRERPEIGSFPAYDAIYNCILAIVKDLFETYIHDNSKL
jgi:hypothetical protein